jgi:hypothetical protein
VHGYYLRETLVVKKTKLIKMDNLVNRFANAIVLPGRIPVRPLTDAKLLERQTELLTTLQQLRQQPKKRKHISEDVSFSEYILPHMRGRNLVEDFDIPDVEACLKDVHDEIRRRQLHQHIRRSLS